MDTAKEHEPCKVIRFPYPERYPSVESAMFDLCRLTGISFRKRSVERKAIEKFVIDSRLSRWKIWELAREING